MIDSSLVGVTYPPTPVYEVGREKIREFADAIGDLNPVYRDPEAARALGYPDVIAPPTFAIVISLAAGQQVYQDPRLAVDYGRVVHGEQRFVAARPIVAGDRLQAVVSIESLRTAGGNDLIGTRADISTADGEPVVTTHAMIVVRGPDQPEAADRPEAAGGAR